MKFAEFLNKDIVIRGSGTKMYFLFETLVLCFLAEYVKLQSKELFIHYRPESTHIELDALAHLGFDDFPAQTVIDIRLYKNNINSKSLGNFMKSIESLPKVKSVLFIIGTKLQLIEKQRLMERLTIDRIMVKIWDLDDLSKVFKDIDIPEQNIDTLSEILLNTTIANSIMKDANQWKAIRKERIEKLKEIYTKDDLVLFLGAGISKEAGIPDWDILLSDLLVKMIGNKLESNGIHLNSEEQLKIVNTMKELREYSPLLRARYIRTGLGDMFENEVSKSIYGKFTDENKGSSLLLKTLVRLCSPRRNGMGVRAVVTYNFDDLLEVNLEGKSIFFKPVYKETDSASLDELPIYHVHGFLPRSPERYSQLTESLLVFSEEGYHTLYNDPYSWQNIAQLNFLRENTCLMIGLSMTDPNLRRLLSIATRKYETPKHFVFMKRQSFNDLDNRSKVTGEALETFTIVNQELQESFFKELGLYVIWVDKYDEIPEILDLIRGTI